MKSKEEIEQMAEKECVCDTKDCVHKKSYFKGYTQCQEDNKDKKYSEEELLDAMSFAECYIIEHDKPLFLKSNGKPVPDCLEYIKSLNKQD
jgi:hypothetical protein